jgi:hypothetical protein
MARGEHEVAVGAFGGYVSLESVAAPYKYLCRYRASSSQEINPGLLIEMDEHLTFIGEVS